MNRWDERDRRDARNEGRIDGFLLAIMVYGVLALYLVSVFL